MTSCGPLSYLFADIGFIDSRLPSLPIFSLNKCRVLTLLLQHSKLVLLCDLKQPLDFPQKNTNPLLRISSAWDIRDLTSNELYELVNLFSNFSSNCDINLCRFIFVSAFFNAERAVEYLLTVSGIFGNFTSTCLRSSTKILGIANWIRIGGIGTRRKCTRRSRWISLNNSVPVVFTIYDLFVNQIYDFTFRCVELLS